jgi:acyl carrier protein
MSNLKQEIKQLIIDTLALEDIGPEDIGDDTPLFGEGLELDSIDALELGIALRKKYQLQLDAADAGTREHFRTVASLARLVENRGQGAPAAQTSERVSS